MDGVSELMIAALGGAGVYSIGSKALELFMQGHRESADRLYSERRETYLKLIDLSHQAMSLVEPRGLYIEIHYWLVRATLVGSKHVRDPSIRLCREIEMAGTGINDAQVKRLAAVIYADLSLSMRRDLYGKP